MSAFFTETFHYQLVSSPVTTVRVSFKPNPFFKGVKNQCFFPFQLYSIEIAICDAGIGVKVL